MERDYYSIPVTGGIPDQIMTINYNGASFIIRVYYSTGSQLWWLSITSIEMQVTLSQIVLRPDVMVSLNGRLPGYSGTLAIGMLRKRNGGIYGSVTAFDGDFGLYLSDGVTV